MLADRAYDADCIRELIHDQGATPKSNRKWTLRFSKPLYHDRFAFKRRFSKLKHFCRVASRYDKLSANFVAIAQLVFISMIELCAKNGMQLIPASTSQISLGVARLQFLPL